MKKIKVSAPGKLHLLGEHAVVYNKPAIIAAVNKRCFIEIIPRKDNKIKVTSKNFEKEESLSFKEIVDKFIKAQSDWNIYNDSNDIQLLKSITKGPLDYPFLITGQYIDYFKLKSINGFELYINSEIPVGAGMGSSGALAVSMIHALLTFTNKPLDKKIVNKIAFLCEQKKHGKPSGGDNTTSCLGGLIWFKKDEGMRPLKFSLSKNITDNFYIINTGKPIEATGEMVSSVRDLVLQKPKHTEKILNDQEELVKGLLVALQKENLDDIKEIIKKGESNLEKLDMVSNYTKKIIRDIEKSGGAAKICGAGGRKNKSGIILIFHRDRKILSDLLKSENLEFSQISLGEEGVRIEK